MARTAFYNGYAAADHFDYQTVINDYSEAIRLKPDFAEAFDSRELSYFCLGQYDEAIADYSQAIRLKPNFAQVYRDRANYYDALGEKADDDWEKLVRLSLETRTNRLPLASASLKFGGGSTDFCDPTLLDINTPLRASRIATME